MARSKASQLSSKLSVMHVLACHGTWTTRLCTTLQYGSSAKRSYFKFLAYCSTGHCL